MLDFFLIAEFFPTAWLQRRQCYFDSQSGNDPQHPAPEKFASMFCAMRAAEKIIIDKSLLVICAIAYSVFDLIAALFLAYCVVYMGMTRYSFFERRMKGDYSYGIYLFGSQITQAVIAVAYPILGVIRTPTNLAFIMAVSVTTTIVFSYGSWKLVEKHSLRLKHLGRGYPGGAGACKERQFRQDLLGARQADVP